MATDFTIVLFNCRARVVRFQDSTTRKWKQRNVINKETRQECVEQVLNSLPISVDCNLLLLVQNEIILPIHQIISKHASNGGNPGLSNKHAEVHSLSTSVGHDVEHLDWNCLGKVFADMTSVPSPNFSVDRLAACVITQEGRKLLLVSWHGPYKITFSSKAQCFRTLINFLDELKRKKECSSVMICGVFNLPADSAKHILAHEKSELEGKVCDDYPLPTFRHGSSKTDYIIHWPASCYTQPDKPTFIDPHYNELQVENPFGCPIIRFSFRKSSTAGPPVAEHQDDLEEDESTDLETELKEQEEKYQEQLRKKDLQIKDLNQQIEDLKTEIQKLRMDSTNRTTDSSTPGGQ